MNKFCLIIALSMLCLILNAQTRTSLDQEIKVVAAKTGLTSTNIRLIWVPSSPEIFQAGIDNGYTITRFVQSEDGVETPYEDLYDTRDELVSGLTPLSNGHAGWNTGLAQAAEYLLYYSDPNISPNQNLSDAFKLTQENLERYQYGMAVAFQDFDVAKKMALGFEDQTAAANTSYIYKIEINGTDYLDVVTISTTEITQFKSFDIITGFSEQGVVKLEWSIDQISQDYFAYDIYRSESGTNFIKLNDNPYIFFDSNSNFDQTFVFQDSLAIPGTTYQYKLKGLTLFGVEGEESDPVEVEALPEFVNMAPIVSVDDTNPNQVAVSWEDGNPDLSSYISGYNIYRSEHATKGFLKMNENPVTSMLFIDAEPLNSGFYVVSAIDQNETEHESYSEFSQIPDHVAPPVPKEFAARVSDKYQLELTWSPLSASDLEGYLIYAQLDGMGTVIMASPDIIEETIFHYNYAPDILASEICFQISSIDHRGNESNKTPCLMVEIPDQLPPSKPIISLAEPRKAGNLIGWSFSISEDVLLHELQRKAYESPDWETLIVISKGEEAEYEISDSPLPYDQARYLDADFPESRAFEYRIMAIDESDNKSYSKRVNIKPYISRFVGEIKNFTLGQQFPSSEQPQSEAYSAINTAITLYGLGGTPDFSSLQILVTFRIVTQDQLNALPAMSNNDAKAFLEFKRNQYWTESVYATLDWEYNNTSDLLYFQIYRSVDGKSFIDYLDVLPPAQLSSGQFSYDDVFVFFGKEYLYKIVAIHSDGRFSDVSKTLRIIFQNI